MELYNFRGKQNSITEALQIRLPEHAVISVTGAGGKTSLIFAWAKELAASGKKVVITTTTHMAKYGGPLDEGITIIADDDPGHPGKVMSPGDDILEKLRDEADVVLIEADGSRRMPLKWPSPWEPVVPEYSDFTVCVAGLSALGRNTSEVIYRAEDLPDRLKRDIVDVNLLRQSVKVRMENSPETVGCYKNCDICVLRSGKAKKNDPPIPADLAPISGNGKRVRRPEEEEEKILLEPIRFRYSTEKIVEEPAPEKVEETASEQGEQKASRSRRRRKPQSEQPKEEKQEQPPQPKPQKEKVPKEPKSEAEAEAEGGEQAKKKPHRRPSHHRRRKPASKGGSEAE